MELCQENSLEMIVEEIQFLRNLMYRVKNQVESLSDPWIVEISQYLDVKLNQHSELLKSHR